MSSENVNVLLHAWLEAARNAAGITQAEIAKRLGVTPQMVSYLENAGSDTRLSVLINWANALGMEPALVPARRRTVIVDPDGAVVALRQLHKHSLITGSSRIAACCALLELLPGTWLYHGSKLGTWLPERSLELGSFDNNTFHDGSSAGVLVIDMDEVEPERILRTLDDSKNTKRWTLVLLASDRATIPEEIALKVATHLHAEDGNVGRCAPTSANTDDIVSLGRMLDTFGMTVPEHTAPDGVLLGEDEGGNPVFLELAELYKHASIFGDDDTRRGAARSIVAGLLDAGWDATIVNFEDGRSDRESNAWLETYAKHHSLPYREATLRPTNFATVNTYAGMDVETITAIIMASQDFEAPYYQAMAAHAVTQAVLLLQTAHHAGMTEFAPTITQVGKLLSSVNLSDAAGELLAAIREAGGVIDETVFDALLHPAKSTPETAAGCGARLARLADTAAARNILVGQSGNHTPLDTSGRGVTYLGLDAWGQPELSDLVFEAVTRHVLESSRNAAGNAAARRRVLLIEGAHTARQDTLVYLLGQARGNGVSVILAGPVPSGEGEPATGLRTTSTKDLALRTQNTNVRIALGGERNDWRDAADWMTADELEEVSELTDGEAVLLVVKPAATPANPAPNRSRKRPVKVKLRIRKPHGTWVH